MTTSPNSNVRPVSADGVSPNQTAGEPGRWLNPTGGIRIFLATAAIGTAMSLLVPLVLTVPIKAASIDSRNATSILSIAVAVAGILSLIAFPIFGRLSDRTLSRFGRRRPYLLLGVILIAIGSVALLLASSVPTLTIAVSLILVGYSATAVSITSLLNDQFSPDRRGSASAIIGLSLPLGAVVGLGIAQAVNFSLAAQILVPAAIAVIGAVLLALRMKDRQISRDERPRFRVVDFFSTFWVNPVKHPNFAWGWFSRFLIFFGVASVQAYQVFYLKATLHFSTASVTGGVFVSTLLLTVAALVFASVASKLAERIGRRKPFVIASALVFGLGLFLAAEAHTFPQFLVAIAVVGAGQGTYFAVDLALVTQLLPDPDNPAKDLGVMYLANNLPQSLVTATGPAILLIGATAAVPHNYPALFILGAIAGLVGALLIIPIRGVK
jgi:MFS family permease